MADTPVYLEHGRTNKVFACSFEWPGWCRRANGEQAALAMLADYTPRYAAVLRGAGIRFTAPSGFAVFERTDGGANTDFGALGGPCSRDTEPVTATEAKRLVRILDAAYAYFDDAVGHSSAQLQKGPRGGGRDRDEIAQHIVMAESAYVRKIGIRVKEPAFTDRAAVAAMHAEVRDVIGHPNDGAPVVPKGWPTRYAARRIIWHLLDHAWEIEDKQLPA